MLGLPVELIALLLFAAFVGALVQGVVGFGLGTMVSPVVALFRPDLVPVAVIVVSILMPIATLASEGRHVDWRTTGWIILGRFPAVVAGVWIVSALPLRSLQLLIALIVLLMVGLSLVHISVPKNPGTLFGAGLLAGITGTSTGVGGPPVAIVLADDDPPVARATMAVVFLVGMALSLSGLTIGGAVRPEGVWAGVLMVPGAALGFWASTIVRGRVSRTGFKRGVLAVSTLMALVLLGRITFG